MVCDVHSWYASLTVILFISSRPPPAAQCPKCLQTLLVAVVLKGGGISAEKKKACVRLTNFEGMQ
jgi:hypothetical protein